MKSSLNLLTNSGSARWMVQRIGGVVIFLYALFILWILLVNGSMSYFEWRQIFEPKVNLTMETKLIETPQEHHLSYIYLIGYKYTYIII